MCLRVRHHQMPDCEEINISLFYLDLEDIKADKIAKFKLESLYGSLRTFMDGQELPNDDELLSLFGKVC